MHVGGEVEVHGMSDCSGMNGQLGTLKKMVGKDKWAVVLRGTDKSKIISAKNLMQARSLDPEFVSFGIVGTWDDWETHQMEWDSAEKCYVFDVVLGAEGEESFKILLEEDWEYCIYPNISDASPYEPHEVFGPDDGTAGDGAGGEWTIGKHPRDAGKPGACYIVRLFVDSDCAPQKVDWISAGVGQAEDPEIVEGEQEVRVRSDQKTSSCVEADIRGGQSNDDYGLPVVSRKRDGEDDSGLGRGRGGLSNDGEGLPVVSRRRDDEDDSGRGRGRGGLFSSWQRGVRAQWEEKQEQARANEEAEKVLAAEEASRRRLVERLELAAAADKQRMQEEEEQRQREQQWREKREQREVLQQIRSTRSGRA